MANTIQHKRSSTSGVIPTATVLSQGELAINIADGKLYTKNNANSVINLGVTSISGTYINPSSGNFSDYLAVNGVQVSISGHTHTSVQQAQSVVTNVFNKTGSPIDKFKVVYINGGQGDMPTIQLAIANGEVGSSKTYGITNESISDMSNGNVVIIGALTGVNTDQFNPTAPVGDVNGTTLWLSPTTSGAVTTSKPYAPNHAVAVGSIVRTHQNAGVVEVRIQNGYELEELHNVATTGATNGQFLQYNSDSGLWIPTSSGNFTSLSVNSTGVSLTGHTHSSSNITDFNSSVSGLLTPYQLTLTNPVTGTGIANHVAYWNSSSGIVADSGQLYWDATNNRLGIGTINPSVALDVAGDVNIDGNLTFDSFTESVVAIGNSSTSKTISLTSGTVQTCTLTGNCVFTMPTATAGKSFTLFLNTGAGSFTATFTGVRWSDSVAPTITSTASKVDILSFISDGTYWYGSFSQNYG